MSDPFASFPTISGGLPTSVDFGPSILFTILYCVVFPVALWRTWLYRVPASLILSSVRLLLFVGARAATFGIRAAEAHAASQGQLEPDLGMFVAEQILLSVGFIVLVSQLVALLRSHLARTDVPPDPRIDPAVRQGRFSLQNISRLMNIALIVAVALGIYAGTQYSAAISSPSVASNVKTYRLVSGFISLVVTALCILISLVLIASHPRLPRRSSAYMLLLACILVIVPAYRVASITASSTSYAALTSTTTKAEFYILQATMEWIVLVLFLAIDTRIWFGMGDEAARIAMGKGANAPVGMAPMSGYQQNGYQQNGAPGYNSRPYGQA